MKQLVHSIWGSTVKLALATSVLAVLVGIVLVRAFDVSQVAVVIGVMVVGFLLSLAASDARREAGAARLPAGDDQRRAA